MLCTVNFSGDQTKSYCRSIKIAMLIKYEDPVKENGITVPVG